MSIGSRKLVDTTTEPFSVEELKIAKNLADGLLRVYGKRYSLERLILDHRLSAEKARQQNQENLPDSSISKS